MRGGRCLDVALSRADVLLASAEREAQGGIAALLDTPTRTAGHLAP